MDGKFTEILAATLPVVRSLLETEEAFMIEGEKLDWNNSAPHAYLTLRNNTSAFITTLTGLSFSNNMSLIIDPIVELFLGHTVKAIPKLA